MLEPGTVPAVGFWTSRNLSLGTKCELQGSHSDPVWFGSWVLTQGQKFLLCFDKCHCPGIASDLPEQVQQGNKSQGILCPARSAQPQTPGNATSFKRNKTAPGAQEGKEAFI